MILIDSSVWIDHLRGANPSLLGLIFDEAVLTHPFVIGELAVGSIGGRREFLSKLSDLPMCAIATDTEVLALVEQRSLFSHGIGFLDAHLLASAIMTDGTKLWTFDRRLHALAEREGCAAELPRRQSH